MKLIHALLDYGPLLDEAIKLYLGFLFNMVVDLRRIVSTCTAHCCWRTIFSPHARPSKIPQSRGLCVSRVTLE